jgi:hypothetical protein
MRKAALIFSCVLALFPFPSTAVTKQSLQEQPSKATRHDDNGQNKQSIPPITVPTETKKDIPHQTPNSAQGKECACRETAKTDWWARISNVAMAGGTLALAVIGAIAACLAMRTLRAIEWQTKVLVDNQRPKIAAKGHGNATETLMDRQAPRVEIELLNRGLTEAYDLTYQTWIEVLPFPFQDFTPAADHFQGPDKMVLYPSHVPLIINIPMRKGLSEGQLGELKHLKLFACIRVRVEYRDSFNPIRWAEFGFYVTSSGLGFLPKYNDAN